MSSLSISLLNKVRNLEGAREAYAERDQEKSRFHHTKGAAPWPVSVDHPWYHPEGHMSTSGDVLKAIVFGGLDGIVTIAAILSGCVGAKVNVKQTLVVCLGNLLADAFAMGFGEYISSKAEDDLIVGETARERWEMDNYPEGERKEMVTLYIEKYGFTEQDAQLYVDVGMQYPEYFLQHMMFEELGLKTKEDDSDQWLSGPVGRGVVMFSSFVCHGLVPLIGFVCLGQSYLSTGAVTLVSLAVLGVVKAKLTGGTSIYYSAFTMAANGAIASGAAYFASNFLSQLVIQ